MGWRGVAYRAVRPLLFLTDAEGVHHATLRVLHATARTTPGRMLCRFASGAGSWDGAATVFGLDFRNRVGLGAGFDKDGEAIAGWAALGLGFVELGTVTPLPQPGNPRPRLVRLPADRALVNRMGFNNAGAAALAARIERGRRRLPAGFVVGINIGRGRDTSDADAIADYVAASTTVAPVSDYLALNVSSPNTPGLRGLQDPQTVRRLVEAVTTAVPSRPVVVKLSPDLDDTAFAAAVDAVADSPAVGLVLSNTTLERRGLETTRVPDWGGVSGPVLHERMLRSVARARQVAGTDLALIASGGIESGADAQAAHDAGADLVQLWTGLVYRGPGLIGDALRRTT